VGALTIGLNIDSACADDAPDADPDAEKVNESVRPQGFLRRLLPSRLDSVNGDFSVLNGITIRDDDSDFVVTVGGRFFADVATYKEDKNQDIGEDYSLSDMRVEIEGRFTTEWYYRTSLGVTRNDTGSIQFDLRDLYVRYTAYDPIVLTLGQQSEPFSLEDMTSARRILFSERALPNALLAGRNVGAVVRSFGNWGTVSGGVFLTDLESVKSEAANGGYGASGRATTLVSMSDKRVAHIGGSLALRVNRGKEFIVRADPEFSLNEVNYADTGTIHAVDRDIKIGIEALIIEGPYTLQAEYIGRQLNRSQVGFSNLWLHGAYLAASWFATGETRPYLTGIGNYGAVDPNNDFGAIELVARVSGLDLTDGDVRGGRQANASLGVNWYIGPHFRLMGNFIAVRTDADANGAGTLIGNDNPYIAQMRLQMFF
jgi:phosphate-selective porin OprO/OprP